MTVLPIAVCCMLLMAFAAGQGFKPAENRAVGVSNSYSQLQQLYSNSRKWRQSYKLNPTSACSRARSGSLCAAAATSAVDAYAQLMLATSPHVYSSIDPFHVGQNRLVSAPMNQLACDTCSAFAVASAAETAMASVLRVNVRDCSISVQALHFCPPNQPIRSCRGGWTLTSTLSLLQQTGQQLPTAACLEYKPDFKGEFTYDELCTGSCSAPSQYASQGRFSAMQIVTMWEAQRHIRQYGSVVTRFDIMDDFRPFFENYANAKAVYKPRPGANYVEGHAVVLVGYDNDKQYWVAKNSWGNNSADNGFFKVAYGVCSVLTPDTGEAYGVIWTPTSTPQATRLQVTRGPSPNCYWYKAVSQDYLSRIAWLAGIPLDMFMSDNAPNVKDLDAKLQGTQLLLCDARPGRFVVAQGPKPSDPQLDALLQIKQAIDEEGVLKEWNMTSGAERGYCTWKGITCKDGKVTVVHFNTATGHQGLRGTLPPAQTLAGLTSLTTIAAAHQPGISGSLPADWGTLVQLQQIALANLSLSGTIPSTWGGLVNMRYLELQRNKLTGQLPSSFQAVKGLTELTVSFNQLTGTIPSWLGDLKQLEFLYLANNKLNGQLPSALRSLKGLTELSVSINQLTGTVPVWLGELKQLEWLNLGGNKFSGPIPTTLGQLRNLGFLELSGNALTGTLPDSFKMLQALAELGLHTNSLRGSVPSSWTSMKKLTYVAMTENPQLTGCMPASWRQQLEGFDVQYYVLDGTQIKGFC